MQKTTAEIIPLQSMSPEDQELFIKWVWEARHINLFDADVLTYPRVVMCKASDGDDQQLFIPLQAVLMYDSIAPKPGITPRKEAVSIARIVDKVVETMKDSGMAETYF